MQTSAGLSPTWEKMASCGARETGSDCEQRAISEHVLELVVGLMIKNDEEWVARPGLLGAMFHSELGAWPWPWNKRTEECVQGAPVTGASGKTFRRSF